MTQGDLSTMERGAAIGLIYRLQDALGNAETGDALVGAARLAHSAEQKLAAFERKLHRIPTDQSDISYATAVVALVRDLTA